MSEETLYCTKNDCYLAGQKLAGVDYLIVHSPAVYPTVIRARSGAGGGWYKRWNKAGVEKLVHGFIDDTGIYHFAPHTMACWQIGTSWGNSHCIGYELCELDTEEEFTKVWNYAAEHYAGLCRTYGLTADRVLGHHEAHEKGFASNHSDPEPYFSRFGKNMDDFRNDVRLLLGSGEIQPGGESGGEEEDMKIAEIWNARKVIQQFSPFAVRRVAGLQDGDTLAVRVAPDASAPLLKTWPALSAGNLVSVLVKYDNRWVLVLIADQYTEYVNASYLSK